MRRPLRALTLAAVCCFATAHVGSPDSIFEGMAGPYRLRVIVRTPGVVPGLADISVRLLDAPRPRAITVLPLRGGTPTAALPPADTARPVSGDSSLYAAQLWLMAAGAYSVQVTASGPAGSGSALVPVMSVATRVLPMDRPLTWALGALGLFLCIGALEVVVAAARESTLAPGVEPDGARRLRAWLVTGVAAAILGLGVWGGRRWWDAADASHAEGMYRPTRVSATVREGPSGRALDLRLDSASWRSRGWTPLIPDHGKLMHLFLVRDAGFPGFAHLHPLLVDSGTFLRPCPPCPRGAITSSRTSYTKAGSQKPWWTASLCRVPRASGVRRIRTMPTIHAGGVSRPGRWIPSTTAPP